MQSSLAVTALLMGLVGGPHCVAMCGAACAGIGQAAGPRRTPAMLSFQAGRVIGYAALGALAAANTLADAAVEVAKPSLTTTLTAFAPVCVACNVKVLKAVLDHKVQKVHLEITVLKVLLVLTVLKVLLVLTVLKVVQVQTEQQVLKVLLVVLVQLVLKVQLELLHNQQNGVRQHLTRLVQQ